MIKMNKYFYDLTHKVTVRVAGVGGTGSHVLNNLARMHKVLKMLGHPGISVRAFDPDIVEAHNVGRQLFYPQDEGLNKASVLISRINRTYGLDWVGHEDYFYDNNAGANIVITCVDKVELRLAMGLFTSPVQPSYGRSIYSYNFYWIDIGNRKMDGQIYLDDYGENFMRFTDAFPMLPDVKEEPGGCNIIDSLNAQELFINEFLANLAVNMLYQMLRTKEIHHNVIYADLENHNIQTAFLLDKEEKAT